MLGPEPDGVDLGSVYRASRERLTEVIAAIPTADAVPVPACPGWSVHDVLSHLVAVIEDVFAGRLTGPPGDEATAEQVARRKGRPTRAVLEEWSGLSAQMEDLLTRVSIWPAALDVLSHEHDVRGAVGAAGARELPIITLAAFQLLDWLEPPVELTVHLGGQTFRHRPDGDDGDPQLALNTTPFEAFRFRLGRRSRRQLAAMAWSGDPEPILDCLSVFGPSRLDIIE
jgi:uncharacterized protein (TIGR03083 family)